jgi:hypothetical protein
MLKTMLMGTRFAPGREVRMNMKFFVVAAVHAHDCATGREVK